MFAAKSSEKSALDITSFHPMQPQFKDAAYENQEADLQSFAPSSRHPPHAKFTADEDAQLRSHVAAVGQGNWHAISGRMSGRTPRQCKERWVNYLAPTLNIAAWTPDEDCLLLEKQREFGSQWSTIARFFANRTDGMVKNRFNRLMRKQRRVACLTRAQMALAWMHQVGRRATAETAHLPPIANDPADEQLLAIPSDFDFEAGFYDGEFASIEF
jgi:hypothetical protein